MIFSSCSRTSRGPQDPGNRELRDGGSERHQWLGLLGEQGPTLEAREHEWGAGVGL